MSTQGSTSRLGQMQMRFQQKIQREKDQKRGDLISPTGNFRATSVTTKTTTLTNPGLDALNSSFGSGKVRQLFEERRQRGTGIDKSYPLQPIQTTVTTTTTTKRVVPGESKSKITAFNRPSNLRNGGGVITTTTRTVTRSSDSNNNRNGTLDIDIDNEEFPDEFNNLDRSINGKLASLNLSNHYDMANNNAPVKLKPVGVVTTSRTVTSPMGTVKKASPISSHQESIITNTRALSKPAAKPAKSASNSIQSSAPSSAKSIVKSATNSRESSANATTPSKAAAPVKKQPPPENMAECKICGRYFNEDRIAKHETICSKTATKKRKVFDTTKHRVQGTEAESYILKKGKGGRMVSKPAATVAKSDGKKSDWRRKHEEFIAAIRAAKEMKAHLARGGKLSDLPPPPPSENPDYIQCPHCSRRFNEAAATRHIPKCATMLHNKPKPAAPKRRF